MKFDIGNNHKKQLQIDRQELRKLGYIQELDRSAGIFSNFALSFSVISILTGLITLYGFSSVGKGGYEFWSWIIVGAFQLVMAFSLGEIASCYPIEGGVYEWTNIIGNNSIGWFNGCISLIGWVACTTGINFGLSEFILEFLGIETSMKVVLFICFIIVLLQTLISFSGIKIITKINNFSVGLHIVGVLAIFILLLTFSDHGIDWQKISMKNAFENFNIVYYIPSLLMTAWTLTAFDASASISEECINPTKTVPYGMIAAVTVSIICGCLILFSLGQNASVLDNMQDVGGKVSLHIITRILGTTVSNFLSIILISAMFSCGLASQTATVRVIYASSRNNALPFSEIWKRVPENYGTPIFSIVLCGVIELILSFIVSVSVGDPTVKNIPANALPIITSLSTVGIYTSYAIVMIFAIFNRKIIARDKGHFYLGKYGFVLNIISFLWATSVAIIMLLFYDINIAKTFLICMFVLLVYYYLHMRKILKYKSKKLSESELLRIEGMRGLE